MRSEGGKLVEIFQRRAKKNKFELLFPNITPITLVHIVQNIFSIIFSVKSPQVGAQTWNSGHFWFIFWLNPDV